MHTQRKYFVTNEVVKPCTHRKNVLLLMRLPNHGHRECFVTNEVVKPWTGRRTLKLSSNGHTDAYLEPTHPFKITSFAKVTNYFHLRYPNRP